MKTPPKGSGLVSGNGTPAISGKSRLVKYYNLARFVHCEYCDTLMGTKMCDVSPLKVVKKMSFQFVPWRAIHDANYTK